VQTRTFLFADLRDYTKFVEHHGDAAAATLIGDYRRLVRAEVARHEGAEVKTEGDSFYVVFNSTQAALRCGIAILRAAQVYSSERPDRPLKVGVGVHAGEPQPEGDQFVGGAVIVAARLAQSAAAGQLLTTEIVRGLLPGGSILRMTPVDGIQLKGIDRPPQVLSVEWSAAEVRPKREPEAVAVPAQLPAAGVIVAHDLIGREAELAALAGFLDDAAEGQGRLVLIAGEAGLGKSALMKRFLEAARERATVLLGECTEIEARRPFGPVADAFESAAFALPRELSAIGPGAMAQVEQDRYEVHASFARELRARAAARPVVLVIEDVHWADHGTLELLQYLPRQIKKSPVLVIGTYRTDELHRRHPLNDTLAELERGRMTSEIRLAPLDEDGTARLIMSALGLDRAPTTEFRKAIHERCGGNPFFTEEVLRAVIQRGDLTYSDGSWRRTRSIAQLELPRTISAAVDQRLRQLSARSLEILRIAGLIGSRFTADLLALVSAAEESELLIALREAVGAQLIVEDQSGREETYRFRHALTREAIVSELLGRERRALHQRIATALESRSGATADRDVEELAYHFDEAGDIPRTIAYRRRAAAIAWRAFAFARAREHLDRVIELAPPEHPDLPDLFLELSRAASQANDTRAALAASEGGIAAAQERGATEQLGDLLVEDSRTAFYHGDEQRRDESLRRALAVLEPHGESPALARALALRAFLALVDTDPQAAAMGRVAIDVARRVNDQDSLVRALNYTGSALGTPEGVDMLRESFRLADEARYIERAYSALSNLDLILYAADEPYATVEAVRKEKLEYGRRHGLRGTGSIAPDEITDGLRSGDWDHALRIIDDSRGTSLIAAVGALQEALILTAREGPEAGVPLLRESAERLIASGWRGWRRQATALSAVILYMAGDLPGAVVRARLLLEEPPDEDRRHARTRPQPPISHAASIAAMLAADELGDDLARDAFLHEAGTTVGPKTQLSPIRTLFAEGMSAELAADPRTALDRYAQAAAVAEEWHLEPTHTFLRLRRARLLAASGDPAAARDELERVLPYWRKAKATWYLGELEKKARAMGIELAVAAG